jgi:anthranilate phosphoribosyltransferase
LLRGAEGEAVAHPRRDPVIEWAYGGEVATWKEEAAPPPELPDRDAQETAEWIESVLAGKVPVPAAIQHQVECCKRALLSLQGAVSGHPERRGSDTVEGRGPRGTP